MKAFGTVVFFSAVGVAYAAVAATTCAADNCNRAVVGSFRGEATQQARLADCSSFQAGTSTAVMITSTSTSTITSTSGVALSNPGVVNTPPAEAARTVPAYASACSGTVRYSSACSCGGFSRASTTVNTVATVFTTTTVTPTPSACGNQGVEVARYADQQDTSSPEAQAAIKFEVVKNQTPASTGTQPNFGQPSETAGGFIETFRGYVYANEQGSYKFTVTGQTDDVIRLWVGATAYSGWMSSNSVQYSTFFDPAPYTQTLEVPFNRYTYNAVRIAFKDGAPPGFFTYKITSPSGVVVSDSSASEGTPFLVQYSCDMTTAPKYPAYGSEM